MKASLVTADNRLNAREALKGYDPRKGFNMQLAHFNQLEIGKEYIIVPISDERKAEMEKRKNYGKWGRVDCEMCMTTDGIVCHVPFIAGLILHNKGAIMNAGTDEECILNAHGGQEKGVEVLSDFVTKTGAFPKFLVKDKLPIATPLSAIKSKDESFQEPYKLVYGLDFLKRKEEYLPSLRMSNPAFTNASPTFKITTFTIDITEEDAIRVSDLEGKEGVKSDESKG